MREYWSDTHIYKPVHIRMVKHRLIYWVVFPQGIRKKTLIGTVYTHSLETKTKKKAFKLLRKYDGAYIERLVQCKLGRWVLGTYKVLPISIDALWDKWQEKPEVIL